MARQERVQILVAGAGPAGLMSALLLAEAGLDVLCVAPDIDKLGRSAEQIDARTTALMQGAIRLLRHAGVWSGLERLCAPLWHLRLIDDTGRLLRAPETHFDAREIGTEPFGWNVPVGELIQALHTRAARLPGLELRAGAVAGVDHTGASPVVRLCSGARVEAALIVAADGRDSPCRDAAGIATRVQTFDQTALVCCFAHDMAHEDTSIEFHRPPGPLTLVPQPGRRSSLVWVETGARAEQLTALGDDAFAAELETATHSCFGALGDVTRRVAFRVAPLMARRFARRRTVLVGEAGHVLPPIGAQGLNLGLRDAALVLDLVAAAHGSNDDIGGAALLAAYNRLRRRDVVPRGVVTDLLNRTLLSDHLPAQAMRGIGLSLLQRVGPLRQFVMRNGVGTERDLPALMRP